MKFLRSEDRRFQVEKVRLPLVALIDVVLFLLLYFMIAGTLAGDESQLASALKTDKKGAGRGGDLQAQILYVEPAPQGIRFRLGDRTASDRDGLASILKQLPKENGIIVKVAPQARVDSAAAALQACKDSGFQKVSYVPGK
jgi:biopolymer transport protein ExbD